MAQVLRFKSAASDKTLEQYRELALVPAPELETSFWPEVSNHISSEHPHTVDPVNSLSRVLFETACVLAVAGALAVAISLSTSASAIP